MTSLSYKLSWITLISPNQSAPSLFCQNRRPPLLSHAGIVFFPPPSPISFFSSIPTHLFGASSPKKLFHLRFLALFLHKPVKLDPDLCLEVVLRPWLFRRRRLAFVLCVCFLFQLLFLHFFLLLKPKLDQPREECFPASSGRLLAVEKLLPAFLNSVSLFFDFYEVDFLKFCLFEVRVLDIPQFLECLCFNIEIESLDLSILGGILNH